MATIEEINNELNDVQTKLSLALEKADAVIAFIDTLQAGQIVTQAQLDAVAATIAEVEAKSDSVNTKLDTAVLP